MRFLVVVSHFGLLVKQSCLFLACRVIINAFKLRNCQIVAFHCQSAARRAIIKHLTSRVSFSLLSACRRQASGKQFFHLATSRVSKGLPISARVVVSSLRETRRRFYCCCMVAAMYCGRVRRRELNGERQKILIDRRA